MPSGKKDYGIYTVDMVPDFSFLSSALSQGNKGSNNTFLPRTRSRTLKACLH